MSDAIRQCVYVTIGPFMAFYLGIQPCLRYAALFRHQARINACKKVCMLARHGFSKIWYLSNIPKHADRGRTCCHGRCFFVS